MLLSIDAAADNTDDDNDDGGVGGSGEVKAITGDAPFSEAIADLPSNEYESDERSEGLSSEAETKPLRRDPMEPMLFATRERRRFVAGSDDFWAN